MNKTPRLPELQQSSLRDVPNKHQWPEDRTTPLATTLEEVLQTTQQSIEVKPKALPSHTIYICSNLTSDMAVSQPLHKFLPCERNCITSCFFS